MGRGRKPIWRHRVAHRGQAMVELALVLPVFLLVLFGLIDVGRLVFTNSMVSQAAREGARVAAVQASRIGSTGAGCVASASDITSVNPGAHICPADVLTLRTNVQTAANSELVGVGQIPLVGVFLSCDLLLSGPPSGSWTATTCQSNSTGNLVSVRVLLTYQPITPIAGSFFGSLIGPITLVGAATMVIN